MPLKDDIGQWITEFCKLSFEHCKSLTTLSRLDDIASIISYLSSVGEGFFFLNSLLRRPPREQKVPGSNPACDGIFSGSSHTSDLNIGTPVATLPGAWRYTVSTGTGRPGVSIL